MSEWPQRLEVARWEFRRYVKPKQLFWSVVITALMGAVGFAFARLAERNSHVEATIVVVGGDIVGLQASSTADTIGDGLTLVAAPASAVDSLRSQVAARELDGLLVVRAVDDAELVVARDRPWQTLVEARLMGARQAARLRSSGMTPQALAELLAPVELEVSYASEDGGGPSRRATLLTVLAVMYGIFASAAYMFASVTGEKQLRISEQVLATISPQTWMDGKLIGLTGVAAVSVATIGIGVLLFMGGMALARGTFALPSLGGDIGAMLLVLLFALLGFVFWLAFLGVVAATVDDPQTSTRGPLMFVPAMVTASAFLIFGNPDSLLARGLSLFPPTAPGVMPARLALTDVPLLEVIASLILLVAGVALMRRAAGKVVSIGMLLYGKEPSWAEVRRWIREP